MKLKPPFIISSSLAPGLRIGEVATLSLLDTEVAKEGRDQARFELYFDDGREPYVDDQLRSGVGGFHSAVEAFESFLGFLEAAGDAFTYEERTGRETDNGNLFPAHMTMWAVQNIDDINYARNSICDENGDPDTSLIEG